MGPDFTNTCTPSYCTLRAAVNLIAPGGTINLDGNLVNLASAPNGILLYSPLIISKQMLIVGSGTAPVTLNRPTTSTHALHRLLQVNQGVNFTLRLVTLTDGCAQGDSGGALLNQGGNVTIANSTITKNQDPNNPTTNCGAAISNSSGTLTLTASTVNANTGGGLTNSGTMMKIVNSTITANSTTAAAPASGGLYNYGGGNSTLINTTLAANTSSQTGTSSNIYKAAGSVTLENTIVQGVSNAATANCVGTVTDGTPGHNLQFPDSTCVGTVADPKLGGLTLNPPGTTQTISLQAGSPAIGAGDTNVCKSPDVNTVDQRGITRKDPCDIGAFDTNGTPTAVNTTKDQLTYQCVPFAYGGCSLRDAIALAAPYSTITFDPSIWGQTIKLEPSLGQLTVYVPWQTWLTIAGPAGNAGITLDGNNGQTRILYVNCCNGTEIPNAYLTLENLTFQNGDARSYAASDGGMGGAIYDNHAGLTLVNSTFFNNQGIGVGAVYASNSGVGVYANNSTFYQNTGYTSASISVPAGAIETSNGGSIVNSTFYQNGFKDPIGYYSTTGQTTFPTTVINAALYDTVIGSNGMPDVYVNNLLVSLCWNLPGLDGGGNLQYRETIPQGFQPSCTSNTAATDPFDEQQNPFFGPHGGPTGTLPIVATGPATSSGSLNTCLTAISQFPTNGQFPAGVVNCYLDQRGYPRRGAYDSGAYAASVADTIGIYRPSNTTFYLKRTNSTGYADIAVPLTFTVSSAALPVVGNWTKTATYNGVGVFEPGKTIFDLCIKETTCATPDFQFHFGASGDMPLAGHWALSDATDGVGVFRPSNGIIYLTSTLPSGGGVPTAIVNYIITLGIPGDQGLMGDWITQGIDTPGVFRPNEAKFYLSTDTTPSGNPQTTSYPVTAEYAFQLGDPGGTYLAIAGDWAYSTYINDGVGLFTGGVWLKNQLTGGSADNYFTYGLSTDLPVAGYWWNGLGSPVPPPARSPVLVPSTPAPVTPGSGGHSGPGD